MNKLDQLFAQRIQGTQSSIVRELLKYSKTPDVISLAGGIPAPDLFDLEGINAALSVATGSDVNAYQYSITEGEGDLREGIVSLLEDRNIRANINEILITNGSQQGLDLVARILLDENDIILVERPTYLAALQVFHLCQANIQDAQGDEDGIIPERVEEMVKANQIKALYLVPNFANPTGSTLSLERRKKLLELSVKYNFVIIEDDPYGLIRFDNNHLPSIYQLSLESEEAKGRVIYLSSFSKILVPGLRMGFIVACSNVYEKLVIAKQSLDLHCPVLCQRIVSAYLQGGRLKDRIPLLCKEYENRCDSLIEAIHLHIGDDITFKKPAGGMFLWGTLANNMDAEKLLTFAVKHKVVFVPGSAFYTNKEEGKSKIRLSYVTITPEQAIEATKRLKMAICDYLTEDK